MSYPKLGILTYKLWQQTQAGKVDWEETAKNGVFQAIFGDNTIQIHMEISQEDGEPYIYVTILNADGDQIERFHDAEVRKFIPGSQKSFEMMKQIVDTARRRALGTEQALDSIISILEKDEEIPF